MSDESVNSLVSRGSGGAGEGPYHGPPTQPLTAGGGGIESALKLVVPGAP